MAVDALYEAEIRGRLPVDTFEIQQSGGQVTPAPDETLPSPDIPDTSEDSVPYARFLVHGVQEHLAEIDQLLVRYADRWALDRMPVIDRSLMRIAVFELIWSEGVPTAVAINEAVELAKTMSTEDSSRFVNGLLGRIAESETSS